MIGRPEDVGLRWRLLGLIVMLGIAAAGGAFCFWTRHPPIPEIPLEGQEPEVADAVTSARANLIAHPRSSQAWGMLGRVLLANEFRLDVALECFGNASRLDPQNPRWPYFSAGILSVDQGQPKEAVVQLMRAVQLQKNESSPPAAPRLMLAELLTLLGEGKQAEGHYYTVLNVDPDNVRAHYGLGMLAAGHGDWELSRTHFEACLNSPEARQKAAAQLAAVCVHLEDQQGATRYATLAAHMPKDFNWTDPYVAEHMQLAVRKRDRYHTVESLEAQGKFDQAVQILMRMVAQSPDDYLPHLTLGRILPQMGQLEKGEEHLLIARRLAPDKIQINYLLSLIYFNRGEAIARQRPGDTEQAKELFEQSAASAREVLAQKPDYGFAHMSLGLALRQLGQRDQAIAEFREAVHCNPEYADIHLFLGETLAQASDFAEARFHLKQAKLLASPSDPRPQAALDQLSAQQDRNMEP